MGTIRVIFGNMPPYLKERLRGLVGAQPDMEMVGEVFDSVELLLAVGQRNADLVILSLAEGGTEPGICSHLLGEYPHLSILALSQHGEVAVLWREEIVTEELPIASDESLLAAIHRARPVDGGKHGNRSAGSAWGAP